MSQNIMKLVAEKENIDVDDTLFNFEKSIKNSANTDDKVNMITDDYKPKTETEYDNKKKSC